MYALDAQERTSQIIRCRETATLLRPQTKQDTASIEGGLQNQREQHIVLIKYEAVNQTAVLENYST